MRTTIFCFLFNIFFFSGNCFGQGTWTQRADFGGGIRSNTVGLSINGKGYFGLGLQNNTIQNDWWEYDPQNNSWTRKADIPSGRLRCAYFTIGDKAYITTGVDSASNYKIDLWEYNSLNDTWTQKANFPGGSRVQASGFSIGNYGYVALGIDNSANFYNDLWQYDPSTNSWSQKAFLPSSPRSTSTSFTINGKAYLGIGAYTTALTDFWEYNPLTDQWFSKANFPLPLFNAVGFSIGNKGYIGTGSPNSFSRTNIFYEYDPILNNWSQKADVSSTLRTQAAGFSIGNSGFIGTGYETGMVFLQDFWEYNPNGINSIENSFINKLFYFYPNPFNSQTRLENIKFNQSVLLNIYSICGNLEKVYRFTNENSIILNKDKLENGIYFVQIYVDGLYVCTEKLLIID